MPHIIEVDVDHEDSLIKTLQECGYQLIIREDEDREIWRDRINGGSLLISKTGRLKSLCLE